MKHDYTLLTPLFVSFLFLSGCGNPQLEPSNSLADLCIGVECRTQPTTSETFIPLFAEQIQHYTILADTFRPNNAVKNFTAIVITMDRTKAWEISPEGTYTPISMEQADQYGQTIGYDTEFAYFSTGDKKGIILTLNENSLKNPELFKKYAHLGTYDLFITYVHELFHAYEQPKWTQETTIINGERDEFLETYEARATRAVIIQQLLNAFIYPQEELAFIKKAVATYRNYQTLFPQDAEHTNYWDTIEGTAYYFELISSLKVGYPTLQADTKDWIEGIRYVAYGKIAPDVNIQDWAGAVNEGYLIGGLAGLLLDHLGQPDWKESVMQTMKSPMELLAQRFDTDITVSDIVNTDVDTLNRYQELSTQGATLDDTQIENLVLMLKQVKEQDINAYTTLVEQFTKEDATTMEKILPLLE